MIDIKYFYIESELSLQYLVKLRNILPSNMKLMASVSFHEIKNAAQIKEAFRKHGIKKLPALKVSDPKGKLSGVYLYDDITRTAEKLRARILGMANE